MSLNVKWSEINSIFGTSTEFPKYTTQLINLANQNSQGTRPKVVGQMSELIQECPSNLFSEWKEWYLKKHHEAIDMATTRIVAMIEKLRSAIEVIDEKMIRDWVEDLVITKTFTGLKLQEVTLNLLATRFKTSYRLADPSEESKGIDGYLNNEPISVKPITYKTKKMLSEKINYSIIYYEKKKDSLRIYFDELEKNNNLMRYLKKR